MCVHSVMSAAPAADQTGTPTCVVHRRLSAIQVRGPRSASWTANGFRRPMRIVGHGAHGHGDHGHGDSATLVLQQLNPLTGRPSPGLHRLPELAGSPARIVPHGEWGPRYAPLLRGAGSGKVLFIDAYTAGVAGDMLCAALLDLGIPLDEMLRGLRGLGLADAFRVIVTGTERSAIAAVHFGVDVAPAQPQRNYASIRALLLAADLPPGARDRALSAFHLLAEAEAEMHNTTVEAVHFHEVGAIDSIVDIVAASIALDFLDASTILASPLPMGRGIIRGAAHGPLPSPAPATIACLCRAHVPTYDAGDVGELVTPTGACLVASSAAGYTAWPTMRPERQAFGAGSARRASRPNLLRLVLGVLC